MTNGRGREKDFAVLTKRRLAVPAWVGLLVVFGFHIGWAQLPETINYQGRLSHAGGALVNGTLAMSFAIYNDKNAATPLWTESYAAVQVTNGQFSVDLGSVTPLTSLTFDEKYWLGITVGADPEMTPRKPFTSVGYAVRALHAQNADHSNNSDHATDSDDATHADDSYEADTADTADYATTAGYADSANTANSAVFATSAGTAATATSATNASHATTADSATSAGTAATATSATNASHATTADTATSAGTADNATHATSADTATTATNATTADSADVADFTRGVKEEGTAIVATGLRGGHTIPSGSAFYTDPVTAMTDLATWCPSPSESSPCLLKIMPGTYDLRPTSLPTQQWVAMEGSGEGVTTLLLDTVLQPAANAEIRSMTLEFTSVPAGPAVDIQDNHVRLSHVTVEAPPGGSSEGISLVSPGTDMPRTRLHDVTVVVNDGVGIEIQNGGPTLSEVIVLATGTSPTTTTAIRIQNASPVLTMVTINLERMSDGEVRGVVNQNNSSPVLNDVHITGQVSGGPPGGSLIGIQNQDSSPSMIDISIHLTGAMTVDVLGILNESNSDPTMQQVAITVGSLGSSCGPEGIVGIRSQWASMSLYGATIINTGASCPRVYGLVVDHSDMLMTDVGISVAGSTGEGISCQDSVIELAGASVRTSGDHGILTEDNCRFRIDQSVVAGNVNAIMDQSSPSTTGYYLIGASKFIGGINEGPGHARFECIASYGETGADSLSELQPDCR
jgi:hypothetical protein